MSQVEIEEAILQDLDDMERVTDEFEGICDAAARAEVAYKTARAAAYLRASGSIKEREAHADFQTESLHLDHKLTEGKQKYGREALQTLRARLDGHRSLNSNLRPLVTN